MPNWTLKIDGISDITFGAESKMTALGGETTLVSLDIEKEIYTPGHIKAVVQIKGKKSLGTITYKNLLGKSVTVTDGEKEVAKEYVIFECLPEIRSSQDQTSTYLTIEIYSPEHYLTFEKYNQCHVAEKLGADIFNNIAKEHINEIRRYNYENLQWLSFENADKTKTEFIQPYLVQYEETPLDFLTRVANDCGEFLFYEDGIWQLGYKTSEAIELKNYQSISLKALTTKGNIKFHSNNYMDGDGSSSTDLSRLYYGMKEEYLATLTEDKSSYTEALSSRFALDDFGTWIYQTNQWLKKPSVTEMITSAGINVAKDLLKAKFKLNDTQDKWNEKFITPFANNKEQCTTVDGKKVVCPLSNYNAKDKFGKKFYLNVREGELKATEGKIHVNFGTAYQHLKLGNIVTVDKASNIDQVSYIVTKINASCKYLGDTKQSYTTYEIDAVEVIYNETEKRNEYYPPYIEADPINKVENQVAIITANNDPWELGRVQFKYPWQPEVKGKPYSPWVRIAQPFASKDATIRFMPQVGDEIMIGYEYGEIERPFMIGALASEKNKLDIAENRTAFFENSVPNSFLNDSKNGFFNNDFIIKSPNGQYIKFLAPSNENFLNTITNFSPAFKFFWSFVPVTSDPISYSFTGGKKLSGGINIGDAYGFFNLNLSTEKRKVLISSAVGDVQIDAMTGITISAPNGNVKIEGKNVEIVAGNNLTLTSGNNIEKTTKFWYDVKAKVFNTVAAEVKSALTLLDLSLFRTIIEGFFKPVGGTMLIKSKRYMRLEAGNGTTALPRQSYKIGTKERKKALLAFYDERLVQDIIKSTVRLTNWYEKRYADTNRKFKELVVSYNQQVDKLTSLLPKFIGVKGVVKYDGNVLNQEADYNDKFDEVDEIVTKIKDNNNQLSDVHPKIDKFEFEKGQDIVGFQMIKNIKEDIIENAEAIARAVREYLTDINNMKKNVNGKVQAEIIQIPQGRYTLDIRTSKNIIYGYLIGKWEREKTEAWFAANPDGETEYTRQDADPEGVAKEIFDNLPANIKNGDLFGGEDTTIDRTIKRKMVYKILQVLKKAYYVTIENEADEGALLLDHPRNKTALNDENVCGNPDTWQKYLECVKPYERKKLDEEMVLSGIGSILGWDSFNLKEVWKEFSVYNPENEGEILLSDSRGNTCKINGETISSSPTSCIQSVLNDIKYL